jgi:(R,R)-butanediol dehydrogenase/meso-butanediol dehydrogenase/diacetyl reductase
MKIATIHGPGDVRLDPAERPQAGPDDVVVRVAACGICGSDVTYVALGGLTGPSKRPMPLGHELSGTIAAAGANVNGLPIGRRVIVNPYINEIGNGGPEGGFADYLLVRNVVAQPGSIIPIPDSLSFAHAALAEPLGVALHAVDRGDAQPGQKAVVFGAGPIGLGAIIALRRRGLTDIVSIDLSPFRLERALKLGARAAINPKTDDVASMLGTLHGTGRQFGIPVVNSDLFIEASGAPGVIPNIIGLCRQGARLVVVAVHDQPVPVDFRMALIKELTIAAAIGYPAELPEVVEMLAGGGIDIDSYISHQFDFADFLDAFALARKPAEAAKVMITFPS